MKGMNKKELLLLFTTLVDASHYAFLTLDALYNHKRDVCAFFWGDCNSTDKSKVTTGDPGVYTLLYRE